MLGVKMPASREGEGIVGGSNLERLPAAVIAARIGVIRKPAGSRRPIIAHPWSAAYAPPTPARTIQPGKTGGPTTGGCRPAIATRCPARVWCHGADGIAALLRQCSGSALGAAVEVPLVSDRARP